MPDRRSSAIDDTDRPDGREDVASVLPGLPGVADVLALPVVAAAAPEVLAGAAALGNVVRWVHVSDGADAASLLDGGELLLSTGAGWPDEPRLLERFVAGLAAVPIAGLVLELGARYDEAPRAVVEACVLHGLPLVVLHRVVKFVAVTEAVHSRIILDQTE